MSFRLLAVLPVVWAGLFVAGYLALEGTPVLGAYVRSEIELVKVLALAGSFAAAFAFDKGDYLRRAWALMGLSFACFLVRDVTVVWPAPFAPLGPRGLAVLAGVLVVAGNAAQVAGTWILARTWKVAALTLPGSDRRRRMAAAAAGAFALAFGGPGVIIGVERLAAGDLSSLSLLASSLGDMAVLCLIAPLLLTALAMRGGLMFWPWMLLACGNVGWLLYDAAAVLGTRFGLDPSTARMVTEACRALACTYGFGAGLAQKRVVEGLRRPLPFSSAA